MRIVIRADGDRRIGTGHVMRMLALAQQARSSGDEVWLASARLDEQVADRVRTAGIEIERAPVEPGSPADSTWLIERASAGSADWVIVDGYRFPVRYQEALRAAGVRVMVVDDDGHCRKYAARFVLNQNVSASHLLY